MPVFRPRRAGEIHDVSMFEMGVPMLVIIQEYGNTLENTNGLKKKTGGIYYKIMISSLASLLSTFRHTELIYLKL